MLQWELTLLWTQIIDLIEYTKGWYVIVAVPVSAFARCVDIAVSVRDSHVHMSGFQTAEFIS